MSHGYRLYLKLSRLGHAVIGLLGLTVLLFFGLTGFILNHEDWFGLHEPFTYVKKGRTPTMLLDGMDKLGIVEFLRAEFAVAGRMDSFEIDDDAVRVVFKGPGHHAEAHIERLGGATSIDFETSGLAGWLTDLHRGKSTSVIWNVALDAASVVLVVVSVSGLVLWSTLKTTRGLGVKALAVGVVLFVILLCLARP